MSATPETRGNARRHSRAPALFSYGFRPFFFFGSIYAGLVILVWIPAFYGYIEALLHKSVEGFLLRILHDNRMA